MASRGGKPKYRTVLLKLSGEALAGGQGFGISADVLRRISGEIREVHRMGVRIAVVLGGGNIFRGLAGTRQGIERVTGDFMGMLGTVINSLALRDSLEKFGCECRVQTAIDINTVAEPFIRLRALRHLDRKRIVIFASGTGNPFFSTDTAAALRSLEINADVIFKATKVDGVFDKDPVLHKGARKFDELSYMQVLNKGLKVMDSTAISLCKDNAMPILVFNMHQKSNFKKAILGHKIGTIIR
jgi:uridylate kinase